MESSVFMDKSVMPTDEDLQDVVRDAYPLWTEIRNQVYEQYPTAIEEWNFPGKKYGWSFRIKDKKRAIVYLLPREGYFKVAFVFGGRAADDILTSDIADSIKIELRNARVYAEGRGIRIDVREKQILGDIMKLIQIKLRY
jgi:hypothetical protein